MTHSPPTFSWSTLLEVTQGVSSTGDPLPPQDLLTLSTDTRSIGPGTLFIPLSGERFDGHDYLPQAFQQGASAALVSRKKWEAQPEWHGFPNLMVVEDPLLAYLALARHHRRQINPTVVAVTGSSGKTTTKDMLYAALSTHFVTQRTEKNHNNEVGLSQTLLALQPGTEVLIAELAMRGRHQIDLLSHHAEPDIGLVINVGPAHIGLLGSIEEIARAKCEIFDGMDPARSVGLVNQDDTLLFRTAQTAWNGTLETYGLQEAEDCRPTETGGTTFTYQGHPVILTVPGQHNVSNALAVLHVGQLLGVPLEKLIQGLTTYTPGAGRWEKTPLPGYTNAWVINDAYNANPSSMQASLAAFLQTPETGLKKVLVLGAMNELGAFSQEYHTTLGQWLSQQPGIEAVFAVGEDAHWLAEAAQNTAYPVHHVPDAASVADTLRKTGPSLDQTLLYLKGSRTFELETIPARLMGQEVPS